MKNSREVIIHVIGVETLGPAWVKGKTIDQIYNGANAQAAKAVSGDTGGLTKFGISQKAYPALDVKNLTIEKAISIYKSDYWDKVKGDSLPFAMALVIFDQAVNRGVATSVKLAQKIFGINADGVAGPQFIAAAKLYNESNFVGAFLEESKNSYRTIAANNSSQEKFLNGWLNRVDSLKEFASANVVAVSGGLGFLVVGLFFLIFLTTSKKT